jgi:hypothetical protein
MCGLATAAGRGLPALPFAPVVIGKWYNNDIDWIDHRADGDDLNGFAGVRQLSAGWQRRPIPQSLGIVQGGCILGVALKNILKFFKGLIKLSLFV